LNVAANVEALLTPITLDITPTEVKGLLGKVMERHLLTSLGQLIEPAPIRQAAVTLHPDE
jgi:hypothetical protein